MSSSVISAGPNDGEQPDQPGVPLWIAPAAVLLGFAGGFVAVVLVQVVGAALGSPTAHPTPAVNITADFLFDFAFVAAALYFLVVLGWRGVTGFLGYRRIRWRVGVVALLVAAIVYYVVTSIYSAALSINQTDKLPTDLGLHHLAAKVAVAVFVCVAAPICEEFFFRGFLFGVLRQIRVRWFGRELGPWIAAVIVGLLFGLAHWDSAQPEFLVPLGFLGFVLCLLRWRTGSLYPGMALHSLNNCVALGVNELAWGAGPIVALCVGAVALVLLITAPLSSRTAAAA